MKQNSELSKKKIKRTRYHIIIYNSHICTYMCVYNFHNQNKVIQLFENNPQLRSQPL